MRVALATILALLCAACTGSADEAAYDGMGKSMQAANLIEDAPTGNAARDA